MLDSLFTNVFGRPKNKSSNNRPSQDSTGSTSIPSGSGMTGPFSMSAPQMPQPPNLPYPPPAPYPSNSVAPSNYYPSLPFSQPQSPPGPYGSNSMPSVPGAPAYNYPANTLVRPRVSPLDSVPFETKFTLNNPTNSVTLEQLFKEIKKTAEVVDRADAYLKSNQSDYDFRTEQGLIYQ